VEIIFNYGSRLAHVGPSGLEIMPRAYVTGQRTRPVHPVGVGPTGIVIASVFPWGLGSLFPEGPEVVDGYVDLSLLTERWRVSRIEEALQRAGSDDERVRFVEGFLIRQRAGRAFDPGVRLASRLLARNVSATPVREAAAHLSMSPRHLSRTFKCAVGVQPVVFARIMRFQRALRMRRMHALSWAAIAARCGFTDQAHMIHELRRFSARTPGNIGFHRADPDDTFNGDPSQFFDTVYM
jgi:AraC-like DNA-binding protein